MNRFFVEDIGPDRATITGEDLKHLSAVLRLKKGDKVMLSDGKGSECQGEIERVEPGRAQVKTGPWRPCVSEPHHKLTLFQCLPKAGKMEVILQKCTELGMNALVPTLSARCVVQPGKDFDKKLQRYRKVAREAAMQSHRGWIPEVLPLVELKKADLSIYEVGTQLLRTDVISGMDLTTEAAVTKLRYLFAKGYEPEEIKRLMEENIRGELSHHN